MNPDLIRSAASGEASLLIKNARVVNVFTKEIITSDIAIRGDTILGVGGAYRAEQEIDLDGAYVTPGLIDSHLHIESSMSTPANFARTVLPHGTTSLIADPHEICNVCGTAGMDFMLEQTEHLPLSVYFMFPSCVPSTSFETSGATLLANDMAPYLSHPRVLGLGEVMDFVSTTQAAPDMIEKLRLFHGKPIDGHVPLLTGNLLHAYRIAGPSSDHECSNIDEVIEKLQCGMHVQLRMGSAAHGIEDILRRLAQGDIPLDDISFCTDDKHLEEIRREGHINYILRRAVQCGLNPIDAICMATRNAARHYGLSHLGAIAPGCRADLVIFPDIEMFNARMVITGGKAYADAPIAAPSLPECITKTVHLPKRSLDALKLAVTDAFPVIALVPGQIVTKLDMREVPSENGLFVSQDGLCKLAVFERHGRTGNIGLGILEGFQIKNGAIASTVGHDSHNLIVAGDNDADMLCAIDALEQSQGGYVVVQEGEVIGLLPLPVAGIMTDMPLDALIEAQADLLEKAAALGITNVKDPFMTLAFLPLPVIPEVRLTDKGVFSLSQQKFLT